MYPFCLKNGNLSSICHFTMKKLTDFVGRVFDLVVDEASSVVTPVGVAYRAKSSTTSEVTLTRFSVDLTDAQQTALPVQAIVDKYALFFKYLAISFSQTSASLESILYWNLTITDSKADLTAVSKFYPPLSPLGQGRSRLLRPTDRQILLYGVARALLSPYSVDLFHSDLRLETIRLDENGYPLLPRFAPRQAWAEGSLAGRSADEIKHLSPAVLRGSAISGDSLRIAHEYAFAMLAYELVEDKLVEVDQQAGESFAAAIVRGARPRLSEKAGKFGELLTTLWGNRTEPVGFKTVVDFLENPENWIPLTMQKRR
jgi:hypothetical protein